MHLFARVRFVIMDFIHGDCYAINEIGIEGRIDVLIEWLLEDVNVVWVGGSAINFMSKW